MTELKSIQLTALENSPLWDEVRNDTDKNRKKSKFFTNKKLPSQEK